MLKRNDFDIFKKTTVVCNAVVYQQWATAESDFVELDDKTCGQQVDCLL